MAKKEIEFTNASWTIYNAQTDFVCREFDKCIMVRSENGQLENFEVTGMIDVIRQRHAEKMKKTAAYRRSHSRLLTRQKRAGRSIDKLKIRAYDPSVKLQVGCGKIGYTIPW